MAKLALINREAKRRDTVKKFASYIRLIYVDVIEFEGKHVRRLYGGMAERYRKIYGERFKQLSSENRLTDADPLAAAMMTTSLFMFYFTVDHLFGVHGYMGMSDDEVIKAADDHNVAMVLTGTRHFRH